MSAIRKILSYTTSRNIGLYVLAHVVLVVAAIALETTHSILLFAGLVSLSLLLWWPITRDLLPVCWNVVVKGRWPDGVNIKRPL